MKLTPVKVRGKGPRKSGFKPPNPKRLKLTTDQTGPGTSLFKQSSAAPIEKLPVEILQKILILSGEHNFPRASLRIGMLLSHPSFIAEMVLKAFEPTWDLWLGCAKSQVHSYTGWYQDTERFGGDPELQSKIIGLPFMNIDIVMAAQQMWVVKNGRSLFYQHSGDYNADDHDPYDEFEEDETNGINDGVTKNDGVWHGVRGYGHMKSAKNCFDEEFQVTCFEGFYSEPVGGSEAFRLEVHPGIRIPDRLITGPLTRKDLELFFWLVHSGAVCKSDQTWEMSLQGVANLWKGNDAEIANVASFLLYAAEGFANIPAGVAPIPPDEVSEKLLAHRTTDGTCHRSCSFRRVAERLIDLVGMNDALVSASRGF